MSNDPDNPIVKWLQGRPEEIDINFNNWVNGTQPIVNIHRAQGSRMSKEQVATVKNELKTAHTHGYGAGFAACAALEDLAHADLPYPITVAMSRYPGFSNAVWIAFADYEVPDGAQAGDEEARSFWATVRGPCGRGGSPDEAVRDLMNQLKKESAGE